MTATTTKIQILSLSGLKLQSNLNSRLNKNTGMWVCMCAYLCLCMCLCLCLCKCLCVIQAGLLWYISVDHGLGCAVAILQLLLPSLHQDHLPRGHPLTGHYLYYHLHVGQVLATGLSTRQSRSALFLYVHIRYKELKVIFRLWSFTIIRLPFSSSSIVRRGSFEGDTVADGQPVKSQSNLFYNNTCDLTSCGHPCT